MSLHSPVAPDLVLSPAPRLAMLVSRFNTGITHGLRDGALAWLAERGIADVTIYDAPGAFELPLMAQALARSRRFEGVICLGCVIKGDTAHFEFISLGATMGIMQAQLETGVPVAFGVLTTYTEDQAVARSRADAHNKGREAAAACVETLAFLREVARPA
ncbi:6,7-dimethyl-8-ribityllumazine synthase [Acidomonas methanolica]|uniref:6,7-dimethyl-8-ribityllumazine synthase n=1 Tax=Acidomonas methanolica NBRC 104435 TaxID=1231351 RepID=A0A023D3E0_ACIMT|nr:6,7-dimethyl-8-ribityllumazine synthase [Acidomonas methanolica]MBU2654840.1 6,7-dimethyl-8-ribityllumazine synthase [Acidomonas methanolica]MCQ9156205.1 6,7-dimethyl-8-ribityllumazine synthase [Acidomonas methanolica]TCS26504.1 6,7-dimethyl-8-ribityllumazine synthase [Acidomonas methanolica]GAJ28663.1 6,7-dimethyl-8-ribityllumazine synthase [Acidomonas methanolica NBRC 104435]GBQ53088.1 6,7-dimethyl-8-ribityllumazine synthase [Acidomonas methanolica]